MTKSRALESLARIAGNHSIVPVQYCLGNMLSIQPLETVILATVEPFEEQIRASVGQLTQRANQLYRMRAVLWVVGLTRWPRWALSFGLHIACRRARLALAAERAMVGDVDCIGCAGCQTRPAFDLHRYKQLSGLSDNDPNWVIRLVAFWLLANYLRTMNVMDRSNCAEPHAKL